MQISGTQLVMLGVTSGIMLGFIISVIGAVLYLYGFCRCCQREIDTSPMECRGIPLHSRPPKMTPQEKVIHEKMVAKYKRRAARMERRKERERMRMEGLVSGTASFISASTAPTYASSSAMYGRATYYPDGDELLEGSVSRTGSFVMGHSSAKKCRSHWRRQQRRRRQRNANNEEGGQWNDIAASSLLNSSTSESSTSSSHHHDDNDGEVMNDHQLLTGEAPSLVASPQARHSLLPSFRSALKGTRLRSGYQQCQPPEDEEEEEGEPAAERGAGFDEEDDRFCSTVNSNANGQGGSLFSALGSMTPYQSVGDCPWRVVPDAGRAIPLRNGTVVGDQEQQQQQSAAPILVPLSSPPPQVDEASPPGRTSWTRTRVKENIALSGFFSVEQPASPGGLRRVNFEERRELGESTREVDV